MARPPPAELVRLLEAPSPDSEEAAWSEFLERYSDTLLRAARRRAPDRDGAMDRYLFILQQLRSDDYRRLRQYSVNGRSKFTSWLLVVANRLCVDFARNRYGRNRGEGESDAARRARRMRRRLAEFHGEELDPGAVPNPSAPDPERQLRARELSRILDTVLAELEPRDRLLLKLRFEDEVPVREIAGMMSFPTVFHVYRRLRKLRRVLRERLEERGVRESRP